MPMQALITGITGQDGRLLSKFLLDKGYQVSGIIRGQNNPKRASVDHRVHLVEADLTDYTSLAYALNKVHPDEVYNLGAISHVGISFRQPLTTADVSGLGCLRMLEAVRQVTPKTRFYQASTSELYGSVRETPQTELTPFHPRSPYGVAKAFAHYSTVNYRESYDLHASCGILFNHESEIRGYEFITRKVTQAAARISLGLQKDLALGNLDAKRDWGYAGDYVEAMWLMLQQKAPSDYVIATGRTSSIRTLLDTAFEWVNLDWRKYVRQDKKYMRPAEVDVLQGDPSKAKKVLGWAPKVPFGEMIARMVDNDLEIEKKNVS